LTNFQAALTSPENLRAEGQNSRFYQIKYWIGCAYSALGKEENAIQTWKEVASAETSGNQNGRSRGSGNRQTRSYFAAMAIQKLNPKSGETKVFRELADINTNMVNRESGARDYQFISASRLPSADDQAFPHYLAGLGYIGLGDKIKAKEAFSRALQISPDFLSAKIELNQF
jgi:tetratricopeptide (TPR) repeat protein